VKNPGRKLAHGIKHRFQSVRRMSHLTINGTDLGLFACAPSELGFVS
jgi:hypothetical protein